MHVLIVRDAGCTGPTVGYSLSTTYLGRGAGTYFGDIAIKSLSGSLVVNAIAAGLAGFSLLFAFFAWFSASRILEIVSSGSGYPSFPFSWFTKGCTRHAELQLTFFSLLLSGVVGWLAFWLDLALVLIVRKKVNDQSGSGGFTGHIGNATWMALGGMVSGSQSRAA